MKNQYLEGYNPKTFSELTTMLKEAVDLYNQKRPHQALQGMTPRAYEDWHQKLSTEKEL